MIYDSARSGRSKATYRRAGCTRMGQEVGGKVRSASCGLDGPPISSRLPRAAQRLAPPPPLPHWSHDQATHLEPAASLHPPRVLPSYSFFHFLNHGLVILSTCVLKCWGGGCLSTLCGALFLFPFFLGGPQQQQQIFRFPLLSVGVTSHDRSECGHVDVFSWNRSVYIPA